MSCVPTKDCIPSVAWTCEKCEAEAREKNKHDRSTTIWHPKADIRLALARTKGLNLKGYSDGSLLHDAGAYGWIIGLIRKDQFLEVARGWGVEREKDNPTSDISTARMEALGLLRMAEATQKTMMKRAARIWK